jgi:membrane dipeptidase
VTPGFRREDVGNADFVPASAIYETPEEAQAQALTQIDLYERWCKQGRVRLLKSELDLDHHLELWKHDGTPGLVLLMESADAIVRVADLPAWWNRGLRIIGLTFGNTRYGVGVGGGSRDFKRGGLTPDGIALLESMGEMGFIWDVSHLAEEGMWQGLGLELSKVCASHANARALTPTDRHLSDNVIRALGARGGVVGLALYNGFLDARWLHQREIAVTLEDQFRRHAEHIAELVGWEHVGIGSDLDGGFGLEESPANVDTVADLRNVGAALPHNVRRGVLGDNWLRFLRANLPRSV